MRRLLLLTSVSSCLLAQTSHSQWLGTWKLRTVEPNDEYVARNSTVIIAEEDDQIRRTETGIGNNGGKIITDSGYIKLDGKPHPIKSDPSAVVTITHIDSRHELITVRHPSGRGANVATHMTLDQDGKSYTQVQEVVLPDGKKLHYTSTWDKQ